MFLSNYKQQTYYLSKKQLFRNQWIKRGVHPIYIKSCTFFGATLIDRTGTLDSGIDFGIIDSIPEETYFDTTFHDVCLSRARQIVHKTKGQIKILWSGGIDSTVALVALLKILEHTDQLHRLTLILSRESIDEYPTFFNDIIKNSLKYQLIESTIYDSIKADDIIITGEHGDQLFGSDKLKYPIITGDAYDSYEQILDFIISRKLGTDKYTTKIIAYLDPLIQKSPIKIYNLYDYFWWLNFALKWQTVSMRLIHGLKRNHLDLEKNVFHFFKSNEFQKWSIFNHDKKIKKEWNSYKFIAKEFIYTYHQDQHYLIHKEKEQSLKEVIVNSDQRYLKHKSKIC